MWKDQIRVLLVEDLPLIRRMIESQLGESGMSFDLVGADTLAQGLAHLGAGKTDVLLLDLGLPDSDGLETFDAIRKSFPDVPAVILTANTDEQTAIEAIRRGAQDFITKDEMNSRLLTRIIQYAIERKGLEREKDRINTELVDTAGRLQEAIEAQNRFLGMASHDLRNPLTLVMCYLDLFANNKLGGLEDRQRKAVEVMHRHCRHMIELLEDLLDIGALESGNLDLKREPTDVTTLILGTCESNGLISAPKDIRIVSRIPDGLPPANLDEPRMLQVLNNLISNAVKYSHSDTTVTVSAAINDQRLEIKVSDEGQGIPLEALPRLFTPFADIGVRATAGEKSTGLGLSIVKKLVEAHDGTITVESQPGLGTTFTVSIPV